MIKAFLQIQLHLHALKLTSLAFYGIAVPIYLSFLAANGASDASAKPDHPMGILLFSSAILILRHLGHAMDVDRITGVFQLLKTTGFEKIHYLSARWLESRFLACLPLAVLLLLRPGGHSLPSPYGLMTYLLWADILLAGSVLTLGLAKPPASLQIVNFASILLPTLFPLFYEISRVPPLMWKVLKWLPPGLAVQMLSGSGFSEGAAFFQAAILALWAIAFFLAAYRAFPWEE